MNILRSTAPTILVLALWGGSAFSQQKVRLGDNAALRYWAAFSEMQDSAITDEEAKKLNGILDGPIPYDDSQYKDLVEKNRPALHLMALGAALPNCDWGLDYQLGEDVPVDYARKALALGRLNVLYAFHLQIVGDKDGAVRALAAGLRFSHDIANGGSLFATMTAKDLLITHIRAQAFVAYVDRDGSTGPSLDAFGPAYKGSRSGLSTAQQLALHRALAQLGPDGLDWQSAAKRDLASLRGRFSQNSQASAALSRIVSAYIGALNDSSALPALQQLIAGAPQQVSELIPNPKRVLEEKRDLTDKLSQIRSLLR